MWGELIDVYGKFCLPSNKIIYILRRPMILKLNEVNGELGISRILLNHIRKFGGNEEW